MTEKYFNEYQELLLSGSPLEAIDQFYSESIIQFENSSNGMSGKGYLRNLEHQNLRELKSLNYKITNVVIDREKEIVWGEMVIHFTKDNQKTFSLVEAFQQKWADGKIQEQRFYYDSIKEVVDK